MNKIKSIIEGLDLASEASLNKALAESIGNNNVTVGSTVAIVCDPTFELDGQRGKVKSIENGFAQVQVGSITVPCHINLLIPL